MNTDPRLSPDVLAALSQFAKISTVPKPDLSNPAVEEFHDQFVFDVASMDVAQRAAFFEATGAQTFEVTQQIYVHDMAARLRPVLAAVTDIEFPAAPSDAHSTSGLWNRLEAFMAAVARLDNLDPALTEIVRLRGARLHDCAICKSRRNRDALDAGATEADFTAVDDWQNSNLPPRTKAALGLVDAMVLTPHDVPSRIRETAHRHLSTDEILEVLLDVVRNAANKIAVALGADAATVTEGVELFTTGANGNVVTVPQASPAGTGS